MLKHAYPAKAKYNRININDANFKATNNKYNPHKTMHMSSIRGVSIKNGGVI